MKAENFQRGGRQVRARIEDGDNVFVNFNGQWEWYTHYKSGSAKGLERFSGYVTAPEHIRILDLVFSPIPIVQTPAIVAVERERLIKAFFGEGMAAKRHHARMVLAGEGMFTMVPNARQTFLARRIS